MGDLDLVAGFTGFLEKRLPNASSVRVTALTEHTEGFSQETFSFEAQIEIEGRRTRRAFVAKREPVAGLLEPYDLQPEFRVLHALSDHPLLSPPTPWLETDPTVLGRPFYIMEKLAGRVPLPTLDADGNGPFDEAERAVLGPQLAEQLALLHAVDWVGAGLAFMRDAGDTRSSAQRELDCWLARIDEARFARAPMLDAAIVWLGANAPADGEEVLLHGDYRTGNYLVDGAGSDIHVTGLLDWEMVHVGDPHEDVAWFISRLWRGGGALAGCVCEPEAFLRAYEAASGRRLDRGRLKYYQTVAALKMAAIEHTGLRAFAEGRAHDLRMAIFDHQLLLLYALLGVELGIVPEA